MKKDMDDAPAEELGAAHPETPADRVAAEPAAPRVHCEVTHYAADFFLGLATRTRQDVWDAGGIPRVTGRGPGVA